MPFSLLAQVFARRGLHCSGTPSPPCGEMPLRAPDWTGGRGRYPHAVVDRHAICRIEPREAKEINGLSSTPRRRRALGDRGRRGGRAWLRRIGGTFRKGPEQASPYQQQQDEQHQNVRPSRTACVRRRSVCHVFSCFLVEQRPTGRRRFWFHTFFGDLKQSAQGASASPSPCLPAWRRRRTRPLAKSTSATSLRAVSAT